MLRIGRMAWPVATSVVLGVIVLLVIWIPMAIWPLFVASATLVSTDLGLQNAALLGDSFGVLNAAVSALAFVLLWRANRMQATELAMQRKELSEQAETTQRQLRLLESQLEESASTAVEARRQTNVLREQFASQGRPVFVFGGDIGLFRDSVGGYGREAFGQSWRWDRDISMVVLNLSREQGFFLRAKLVSSVPPDSVRMVQVQEIDSLTEVDRRLGQLTKVGVSDIDRANILSGVRGAMARLNISSEMVVEHEVAVLIDSVGNSSGGRVGPGKAHEKSLFAVAQRDVSSFEIEVSVVTRNGFIARQRAVFHVPQNDSNSRTKQRLLVQTKIRRMEVGELIPNPIAR